MTKRRRVYIVVVVMIAGLVAAYPVWKRARELNARVICAGNLKGLATCIKIYCRDAEDNRTASATDAFACSRAECGERILRCPQGHGEYVLSRRFLSSRDVDPRTIVAYEPLENHIAGANVVYGDGHAEFVDAVRFQHLLASIKTGDDVDESREGLGND